MWEKGPGACRGEISAHKSTAAPTVPQIRPGREALDLLPGAGFALSTVDTRHIGGILERPQHVSNIPQGRVFELALAHQLLWLPLEVKNDQVVAGIEYLAQVIVTVTAEALSGDSLPRNLLEALQQTLPQREEAVRILLDLCGQELQLLIPTATFAIDTLTFSW